MMETVLTELYDALTHLRYPEIAKIESKDLARTILTGQNRIVLLKWLLSQASVTLSSHLEKFQGNSLKDEVVKCYSQIGISIDENALLGNCSLKQQISTLKSILLFAKSLKSTETVSTDDSAVYEVLDKHMKETVNIIPSTCQVSMKLTDYEAKKYLEEVKTQMITVICLSPESEPPKITPSLIEEKIDSCGKTETENGEIVPLHSVAEEFNAAFESTEFWSNSRSSDPPIGEAINMDETIQNLCKDLSSIAQIFESKKEILAARAPKCLNKYETPLSSLIENNVIISEEIRSLYDQGHSEN